MFEKSKWIWENAEPKPDEYVEFLVKLNKSNGKKYVLNISVDTNYSVSIGGVVASFGQYSDYPTKKSFNSVDITDFLKSGENEIIITAYYLGVAKYGTYALGEAGLIFDITEDGNIVAVSDENVLSRLSPAYESHKQSQLTFCLGYRFTYDMNAPEREFTPSVIRTTLTNNIVPRPNKKLVLRDRVPSEVVKYGTYVYGEGDYLGAKMHASDIKENADFDGKTLSGDGNVFFIVELDKEHSGFLDFDIELGEDCDIDVGYGEHLLDGLCRTIHNLDYTAVIHGKKGSNIFTEKFRRFGCRYIQFFIHSNKVKINYAGLRPTEYPITFKPLNSGNELRDKIYDVAAHTLLCDMHEHYEDCCQREQCLYSLDSRNEMKFTYYSTGDFEFARSCLALMNQGRSEESGLLHLTYPARTATFIPSYSPCFFLSCREYIEISGDQSLAAEVYDTLDALAKRFFGKLDERGVICNFSNEPRTETTKYWDFFDWTDTMHDDPHCFDFEAPLNAWFSIALDSFAYICDILGKHDEAETYRAACDELNRNIAKVFFNEETGLFKSFENKNQNKYSVYTQSLCVLCGAAKHVDMTNVLKVLETNGKENFGLHIDADTLGSCCFRYDALIGIDEKKYTETILNDIDATYKPMLDAGATTFWETADGAEDYMMGGTASLCHAWSSAPLLYYRKLILGENL